MATEPARRAVWAWRYASLVVALVLPFLACMSRSTPPTSQPTPTARPTASTVYFQGGALRASDGGSLWSANLGAEPPLMGGGVAYVLGSTTSGQSTRATVTAVRLTDGAKLWASMLPADSSVGPDVLTGNGLLVVATAQYGTGLEMTLRLAALRAGDGSIGWQSAPLDVVRRPTVDTPVPFVSSLAFFGGRVVALADAGRQDAFAAAWSAADGSLAWRMPLPNAGPYAGAAADLHLADGLPLVAWAGTSGQMVGALDVARGVWIWTHVTGSARFDLVTDGVVLFSDGETGTALRVTNGTALWTLRLGSGAMGNTLRQMAVSDTTVFYGNFVACPGATTTSGIDLQVVACQQLYAVSLTDGKLLWQHRLSPNPIYNATYTAYGDGILYYQYFTGNQASGEHVTLLALAAARGIQLWARETGSLFETIAAGAGAVYGVGPAQGGACSTAITAYGARDASQLWQQPYAPCPQGFIGGFYRFPWLVVG
jgi:outer membrane protein assembly factor BamB